MNDNILEELKNIFKIKQNTNIEFKEIYGLTFVALNKITILKNEVISAEIKTIGIIYKENDDYYFAPLSKDYNLEKIIAEYVEKYLKN